MKVDKVLINKCLLIIINKVVFNKDLSIRIMILMNLKVIISVL